MWLCFWNMRLVLLKARFVPKLLQKCWTLPSPPEAPTLPSDSQSRTLPWHGTPVCHSGGLTILPLVCPATNRFPNPCFAFWIPVHYGFAWHYCSSSQKRQDWGNQGRIKAKRSQFCSLQISLVCRLIAVRLDNTEMSLASCWSWADSPIQECLECQILLILSLCTKSIPAMMSIMHVHTEQLLPSPVPHAQEGPEPYALGANFPHVVTLPHGGSPRPSPSGEQSFRLSALTKPFPWTKILLSLSLNDSLA